MRRATGQATIEVVLILPLVLAVLVAAGEGLLVAWSAVEATDAARVGARAGLIGADAERSARAALPRWLRGDARVVVADDGRVRVTVAPPPGLAALRVTGEAG